MRSNPPVTGRFARLGMAATLMFLWLLPTGGCRMCAECNDLDYAAYGGAWQRTRRASGRVGSVLDPAGAKAMELVPKEAPTTPDERQRQRQLEESSESAPEPPPGEPEAEPAEDESPEERMREKLPEEIEIPGEEDLRGRTLDDIDVKIIPGDPLPPVLR